MAGRLSPDLLDRGTDFIALCCHDTLEIEAARVRSEQIDAELASEGALKARKRKEEVHVLLLGKLLIDCTRQSLP